MLEQPIEFIVTDLKQFEYCPRIVFYAYCLPHIRPRTYKMEAGHEAHEQEQERARRRTFVAYGLPEGERRFEISLFSKRLGIWGKLDELVLTADEAYPIDYKQAKHVSHNHRLQLAAYALLVEETTGLTVNKGFIRLIDLRKNVPVEITAALRAAVETRLTTLQTMVQNEAMPEPTGVRNRCIDCEFRRFCNDV